MSDHSLFFIETKCELITQVCGTCGIVYAVPRRFHNDGKLSYCPNGHHSNRASAAVLEESVDKLREKISMLYAENERLERSNRSLRAIVKRGKK